MLMDWGRLFILAIEIAEKKGRPREEAVEEMKDWTSLRLGKYISDNQKEG